jgi:hypothetical protein
MGSEVWVGKMLFNRIISSSGISCSCNLKYQREEASYILQRQLFYKSGNSDIF